MNYVIGLFSVLHSCMKNICSSNKNTALNWCKMGIDIHDKDIDDTNIDIES